MSATNEIFLYDKTKGNSVVEEDEIPFVILNSLRYECQYGKDKNLVARKRKLQHKEDEMKVSYLYKPYFVKDSI